MTKFQIDWQYMTQKYFIEYRMYMQEKSEKLILENFQLRSKFHYVFIKLLTGW